MYNTITDIDTWTVIEKYIKYKNNKLNELKPYTKLKPLNFFSKIGYPGESNHIGGIFPMSNKNEFLKTNKLGGLNNSKKISKLASALMLEKKAYDIKIIDVKKITTLTDIFMICTSDSDVQSRAITNNIKEGLDKYKIKPLNIEGYQFLKWVLMDYVNVTINIFQKEYRNFYNIERLWADAKVETIKDKPTK